MRWSQPLDFHLLIYRSNIHHLSSIGARKSYSMRAEELTLIPKPIEKIMQNTYTSFWIRYKQANQVTLH